MPAARALPGPGAWRELTGRAAVAPTRDDDEGACRGPYRKKRRGRVPPECRRRAAGPQEHPGNLNEAIQVLQLNVPLLFRYWVVYQNVQSSLGSILIAL